MVHDDERAQIREGMGALRRGIDGFRSRRPQLEMVATVATAIGRCRNEDDAAGDGEHIAVIEAGTGTGKSFGALVPALVMARSRGRRLVVSSSTVALQHQYAEKDAPTLQRLLPMGFTFAVAKGRRRYACAAKLLGEAIVLTRGSTNLPWATTLKRLRRRPPPHADAAPSFCSSPSRSRASGGTGIATNSRSPSQTTSGQSSRPIGKAVRGTAARSSRAVRSTRHGSA